MLRWLMGGGGREPQGLAEKSPLQTIVLKAHHDIVRFLVQLDGYRFVSAGTCCFSGPSTSSKEYATSFPFDFDLLLKW
uniref:Uncharacterized protein n=1 Tax=Cebus imitator TaxID=2715852 RepID=A0A2K5PN23_CEBIM